MGKPRDKYWDYAEVIPNEGEGKDKVRWKCKFCNNKYSGGASRIKAHLAKVEGEGIKVCEAVDEATMRAAMEAHEAVNSNKRPRKRGRLDSGACSTAVADLQSTLPFLDQSNLDGQMQRNPDAIQRVGFSGQIEQIDRDDNSTCYSFGESTVVARMQEFEKEIQGEGPLDAQGYINDQSNAACSGFDAAETDRSGWHQSNSLQPQELVPLSEDQGSLMVRCYLQSENVNEASSEIARSSLAKSTYNVQGTSEVNICEDNLVQDQPDPLVEACQAINIMPVQPNRIDPMHIDPDPKNEANGGIASVLPLPSSARDSVADETAQPGMLAPKLVGRERIVDELWGYLMTNDILRIGVYGMGGVGKTTTMKHLYNKVRDSAAFENVFWVTVSKECSIHELQNKIARALMVPELFKDVDEGMRPTVLFNHLSKKKKCLVILDDMWRHYELADVGIPVKRDGVRLVLTTRYRDVCEKISCEEKIGVRPLSDEEAWALFVQTLGSDLPPSRKLVAEHIVKECKGLPLAIVVMAGSMKGEVEDHAWEATLENLKRPGVPQQSMKEDVFPILVHSYNRLDEKKQLCFSLCALYPEDWSIPRQELIELCIDEGVICEDRRRKMYNEGHRLLDELEKACLLEAHSDISAKAVRMHDVIRDMALDIINANNGPCMVKSGLGLEEVPDDEEWLPNLQKVSLMCNRIEAVPPSISPNCPQLATLLLSECDRLHKISKRFFRRMQGLKVIDLRFTGITKVPKSVMNLKKLRALVLSWCSQLSRIPSLAKSTSLRKLDLLGCVGIKEVPDGLGMLVNLTYLCLSPTGIKRIPDGVVCKLKKLQHLKAENIAVKGEEVGKLRKLELLRCRFENVNELNEYTRHATTLESYFLVIGDCTEYSVDNGSWDALFDSGKAVIMSDVEIRETCHFPRDVKLLRIINVGTWKNISSFTGLEELEVLMIRHCDELSALGGRGGQPEEPEGQQEEPTSQPPPGDHCPNLKVLKIYRCPKLKHLLVPRRSCNLYLKKPERLEISGCEELESIIDEEESLTSSTSPLPPDAFSQLQSIEIFDCPKMKRVLTLESFMLLPNLQTIIVGYCKEMKEVIGGQELDHGATSSLFLSPIPAASPVDQLSTRKLTLVLSNLKELKSICSWTGLRDLIHVIELRKCPKLKRIEMLDDASPPPSLKEIVLLGGDYELTGTQWWESLGWVHPEAKTALEPYVFVYSLGGKKIPLRECRSQSAEGLGREGWTQTVLRGGNDTRQGGGFIQGGTMGSIGLHHEIPY